MNTLAADHLSEHLETFFEKNLKEFATEMLLQKLKSEAWKRFKALSFPTRTDEKWRFSHLEHLKLEAYDFSSDGREERAQHLIESSNWIQSPSKQNVFINGKLIERSSTTNHCPIHTLNEAWGVYSELLEHFIFKYYPQFGGEKFYYMNLALNRDGLVIHIPKGIVLEKPIVNYHWLSKDNKAVFSTNYLIIEEGAHAKVIDIFLSSEETHSNFYCGTCLIHVMKGGSVERIGVQLFNEKTVSMLMDATFVEEEAKAQNIWIHAGSQYARLENQVYLKGKQADAKLYSLGMAKGHQELDQRTYQEHMSAEATSDLLYKNVLLEEAKSIFSGLIRVHQNAQQTDAYQKNRNLLLSEEAEAIALPGLEIGANNVKCSHGATSGNIDETELFYMLSRGIPKKQAQALLGLGFLEEIINKVSDQELKSFIHTTIGKKFSLEK